MVRTCSGLAATIQYDDWPHAITVERYAAGVFRNLIEAIVRVCWRRVQKSSARAIKFFGLLMKAGLAKLAVGESAFGI